VKQWRLVLVDSHPMFLQGMRSALGEYADIRIVGEATNGQAAIGLAAEFLPDVVLCAIVLPGISGFEVTRAIRRKHPSVAVCLMGTSEDDEQVLLAIRSGAAAYLNKDVEPAALLAVVRRAGRGEYPINESLVSKPQVASRVLQEFRALSGLEVPDPGAYGEDGIFVPITGREVEILDRIARGEGNKQIGRSLAISDQTVKNHVTSILRKLTVNDRTQAVMTGLRRGWIKMPEE
jgi:DNA-binding NarL/FixJ family response regulator